MTCDVLLFCKCFWRGHTNNVCFLRSTSGGTPADLFYDHLATSSSHTVVSRSQLTETRNNDLSLGNRAYYRLGDVLLISVVQVLKLYSLESGGKLCQCQASELGV